MFDFSKLEFITKRKVPANLQEIVEVEKKLGLIIPDAYKEFLLEMNGAELSDELLYSTDDLVEMNILNEVREYAPGFISIGSDNGDYELLMKAAKDEIAFRLVDAGDMVPDDEYNTIYPSFKEWINNGAVLIEEEEDEDWEADYYYYNKEDWKGLIKYREQRVKNYPEDLDAQWQLGEAYVFNSEFKKALEVLEKVYYKDPHDINVKHSILDALFGLDRTENDFNWIEKPMILRLNQESIDICYNLLKPKRKPKEVADLYIDLMCYGYLTFEENDLLEAILNDGRFIVYDEYKLISGKYVSVSRNKKS